VILIDDGLATGATMRAAAKAVRTQKPKRLIIAVPVGARQACDELREGGDECLCCATPEPFVAVGAWYELFAQVSDQEVIDFLQRAEHERMPEVQRAIH
jgi:predicted phosphoribosyltransferase